MSDEAYNALLDLIRRLPPTQIATNLSILCQAQPELADDLLMAVDQPLKVLQETADGQGRQFLGCEYNKDGESYRSPWTNAYHPPLPDGTLPSAKLRDMEVQMNAAFDTYREMYFEGGLSSVYLWDTEDGGFAGVVLMKKALSSDAMHAGSWDSLHVFEVRDRGRTAQYNLTSTVILDVGTKKAAAEAEEKDVSKDGVSLSGTMTRQIEQELPLSSASTHVMNIGRLVEDMEFKMRNSLCEVYFGKTKDVIGELRSLEGSEKRRREADLRRELVGMFGRRKE